MKIFVAGGTGVIGRRLVPLLVTSGLDVTAVARSENKARALTEQGARAVRVDIFDADAVERAVKGHDVVINMATRIPPSSKVFFPGSFNENNRIRQYASRNLSQAAMKAGAERFIQESFSAAYPDCGDEWIEETVSLEPAKYVRTVLDAERAAFDFTRGGGVGVVLRFSFFYGPDSDMTRDIVKFVRKGIAPALGHPDGYMSSIWLDDAASAVVASLRVPAGAYNVTDDEPVTRRAAFDALAATIGVKAPKMLPA
ncbi:MAG TPA: NAD(P)-dependent oxidoreductase, partial [Gemmatimonadaceae bacterium]|nr:NAD(P)-dependent oxidoreductase [Gemmatimonadaceae bacterium]